MKRRNEVAVLDIGSVKVVALIGRLLDNDRIEVIGMGKAPTRSLRHGVVVDLDATVKAIEHAIYEAEMMADQKISTIYAASVCGNYIKGKISRGMISIPRSKKEITEAEVERVIQSAKPSDVPADTEILDLVPLQYIIDNQEGIKDPIGMEGNKLEVEVFAITGLSNSLKNIQKCITRAGIHVEHLLLSTLASGYAVLDEDEKELGVILIDIGGGLTDIGIFLGGALCFSDVVCISGDNVTKDISFGLRLPLYEAERVKIAHGVCLQSLARDDETFSIKSVNTNHERIISKSTLAKIIEPRMEEVLNVVKQRVALSGYEKLVGAGAVLTGGSVMLKGITELAERILDMPVRIGKPKGVEGLTDLVNQPIYSTAVGLLIYSLRLYKNKFQKNQVKSFFSKLWRGVKIIFGVE